MKLEPIEPPTYWREFRPSVGHEYMRAWEHKIDGLTVMRSLSTWQIGPDLPKEYWFHISVSRRSRLPTWEDLAKVKRDFLGPEVEAYQVLAKESQHVNVHAYCLHLWAPLDGFRRVANLQDLVWEQKA